MAFCTLGHLNSWKGRKERGRKQEARRRCTKGHGRKRAPQESFPSQELLPLLSGFGDTVNSNG